MNVLANTYGNDIIAKAFISVGLLSDAAQISAFEIHQDLSSNTYPGSFININNKVPMTIGHWPTTTLWLRLGLSSVYGYPTQDLDLLRLALINLFMVDQVCVINTESSIDVASEHLDWKISFRSDRDIQIAHLMPPICVPIPAQEIDLKLYSIKSISRRKIRL